MVPCWKGVVGRNTGNKRTASYKGAALAGTMLEGDKAGMFDRHAMAASPVTSLTWAPPQPSKHFTKLVLRKISDLTEASSDLLQVMAAILNLVMTS